MQSKIKNITVAKDELANIANSKFITREALEKPLFKGRCQSYILARKT
jgi:hypothetical protein